MLETTDKDLLPYIFCCCKLLAGNELIIFRDDEP